MVLSRTDLIAGTLLVATWSSGFISAELGTRDASAETFLTWRAVAAALIAGGWLLARRPRLGAGAWTRLLAVGALCQAAYLGGVVAGVGAGVAPGTAALLAALQPVLVALVAAPLLGERTTGRQRAGLAVGVLGVAVVVLGDLGGGAAWAAYLAVLGGTAALALGTVLERRWSPTSSTLDSLLVQTLPAPLAFGAVAAARGTLAPPADAPMFWVAVAWGVVLATLGAFGSYLWVLRRSGATAVSTVLLLTPPVTTLWAWAMFGLAPGLLVAPGTAVVALGVWLVVRPTAPPSPGATAAAAPPEVGVQPGREVVGCAGSVR